MPICSKCKIEKDIEEMAWRYEKGIKKRRGTCSSCIKLAINKCCTNPIYRISYSEKRRIRRLEKAKYLFDYLLINPCKCGVSDPFMLQFDHVRGVKSFQFGSNSNLREQSFENIKSELEKCDVICGNCHMRKTRQNGLIWTKARKKQMMKAKLFVFDYLSTHPCVDCGETDPVVLEFDHVRGTKLFTICPKLNNIKFELIKEEITKCDIRCTNCHLKKTIQTSANDNWYKVMVWKESLAAQVQNSIEPYHHQLQTPS